jgi:putative FmdB family regulatory protein
MQVKYRIMPLFEYACRSCGHHFEFLTRDGVAPACPACESDDLQKLLSVFAVGPNGGGKRTATAAGPCHTCGDPRGPGACSIN